MLVRQVFRQANGKLAVNTQVDVTLADDDNVITSATTDSLGTVVVELATGLYDWIVNGDRTPFEVIEPGATEQEIKNTTDLASINAGIENMMLWYENGKV